MSNVITESRIIAKVVNWIGLGFMPMVVFVLRSHDNVTNCVNERSAFLIVEITPPAFLDPVLVAVFHQISASLVLEGWLTSPGD